MCAWKVGKEAMETQTPGDGSGCGPVLSSAMRARLFTFKPAAVVDVRASTATPFVASTAPAAAAAEAQREQEAVLQGETAARKALFDLLISANRGAVEHAAAGPPRGPGPAALLHASLGCGSDDEDDDEAEDEDAGGARGRRRRAPRRTAAGVHRSSRAEGFVAERECDAVDNNAEYRWRKYGEKPSVSKSKKRCYYKCVCPGCPARVCAHSSPPTTTVTVLMLVCFCVFAACLCHRKSW